MTTRLMELALAAAAVVGVGAVKAQEMGSAPTTAPVPATASVAASAESEQVKPVLPADDGQKIVVEAQAEKEQAVASEAKEAEGPTATTIVQNLLAGLDETGKPVAGKKKYKQGFDPVRRAIIHIGTAMAPVANPASSANYIQVRQMLAQEAVLNAKVKIIRELRQYVSAAESIGGSDTQEADAFKKKHAEEYARLEAQRAKVLALVEELDAAEAARLKGRTLLDDWNSMVDAVVKKLDKDYDPSKAQAEKVARCAMVKEAVAEAKATLKALEEAAAKTPMAKNKSDFSTYFDMDLYGVTVLFQAESYDADGNYEVAVASVWSPKLQDRAIKMLNGIKLDAGNNGEMSLDDWLRANDGNLAAMVGPRQYTDDKGIAHILGIAACEVPKNANRRQNAFEKTDLTAEQTVSFALYESTKGNKSKFDEMLKYDGDDNSAKENDTLGGYAKTITGIIAKRPVSGLSVIYQTQKIHPISQKKIYIAVASIDGNLSEVAEGLLDEATAAKMEDIAHLKIKAGRQAVRDAAAKAAEQSSRPYDAGVELGARSLSDKVNKRAGNVAPGMIVVEPTAVTPTTTGPAKARTGVFSGDTRANDDF